MKFTIFYLTVFMYIFCSCKNVIGQEQWEFVGSAERYLIYYDTESVQIASDGSYQLKFKYKCISDCNFEEGVEDYILQWYGFSCSRGKVMAFRPLTFYENGETYDDEPRKKVWTKPREGSLEDDFLKALCD